MNKPVIYKKMAGTAAVFVACDYRSPSPVERDGMSWTASELGLIEAHKTLHWKPVIESSLALEGLEEYDPPAAGDARYVTKLGVAFVYVAKIRGWVQITAFG
jgi:hypothetical protein